MKIRIIIVLFLITSLRFIAQEDSVIFNDPNYSNTMIQVYFGFDTDFKLERKSVDYPERANITYNIQGSHYFSNIPLELSVLYSGDLLNNLKDSYYLNYSENELYKFNILDIGVTYNFIDNMVDELVEVNIGSKTNFSNNTRTVLVGFYDGTTRKRMGVHIGMFRYTQSITLGYADGEQVVFIDGTKLPTDESLDIGVTESYPLFYTTERHLSTYVGLAYHRNNAMKVKLADGRKRYNMKNLIIYGDVLIDVFSDIQKLGYNGELYDFTTATSGVNQTKIGFRLGVKRDFSPKHGAIWAAEVGKRPQYFGDHCYFQFGIGYAFKTKI